MELKNENKLTDNELEQVAGGFIDDDSKFLNVLLRGREGQCDRVGWFKAAYWKWKEVAKAWASVGVEFRREGDVYDYHINGKLVSKDEAWLHAEQVVGKHLKRSDWDW